MAYNPNANTSDMMRNSSRVLKPPGGGSSDIFSKEVMTPRRFARQQQAGSLGQMMSSSSSAGGEEVAAAGKGSYSSMAANAQRNGVGTDSHSRLFGGANPNEPNSHVIKNRMKSNIMLGDEQQQQPAGAGAAAPVHNTNQTGGPDGDCDDDELKRGMERKIEKLLNNKGEEDDNMIGTRGEGETKNEEDEEEEEGTKSDVKITKILEKEAKDGGPSLKIDKEIEELFEGGGGSAAASFDINRDKLNGEELKIANNDNNSKCDNELGKLIEETKDNNASKCTSSGRPISRTNNIVVHNDILKPQKRASCRRPDGNPVTGNGYPESTNGSISSNGSVVGSVSSSNGSSSGSSTNGSSNRSRVPPGGFSSGLW